jgi:hypothetical protein
MSYSCDVFHVETMGSNHDWGIPLGTRIQGKYCPEITRRQKLLYKMKVSYWFKNFTTQNSYVWLV